MWRRIGRAWIPRHRGRTCIEHRLETRMTAIERRLKGRYPNIRYVPFFTHVQLVQFCFILIYVYGLISFLSAVYCMYKKWKKWKWSLIMIL